MKSKHNLLRGLLWFICIYHVVTGLTANLSDAGVRFAADKLAGVQLRDNPELFHIARPFGVYVICFGVLMGLAAWNPVKNRAIITVGVLLFLARALQRIIFAQQFQATFNVSAGRNAVTITAVCLFAVALAVLRILLYQEMKRTGLPKPEVTA